MKIKIKTIKNILYAFMILLSYSSKIHAQISPGNLTFAHAKLEGLSNCTKCHVMGKQLENSRCLSCHAEIKTMIDGNIGYHSSSDVKNKNCWDCHSEHHGRSFRIINFYPDKFDHNKAGFKLDGKHSQIKCEECHQTNFITNSLFKKRNGTYLGLSTNCVSCHEDVHQNALGNNCASCHNTVMFKPAALFNHETAKFKLSGAHTKVECVKCHIKETLNLKPFQKFVGLQFRNCTPCHQDVHKGQFGENCIKCHNVESFKIMNKNTFDHSKTRFPLEGAHQRVSCVDCHGENLLSKPKFAKCTDCHKDAHFDEFTVNNVVTDCKECHDIFSFKTTLFTIREHNKAKLPLTGAHLAVSCQSCHYKTNLKQWHFRNIGIKCIDCHENVHGTELTEKFMPDNRCESCHVTDDWKKIHFDHDLTNFKLSGKHSSVSCRDCHEEKNESGKISFRFASLHLNCTTCHNDVHFGQFNSNKIGSKPICENCHGYDNWKPIKFDHEKSDFPLKGAHEKVSCSSCHKKVTENGNVFIQYILKDFKCASCHA
ncbi:MAG: cytochrome C [Ignavibacteriaceae bacterium]